MFARISRLEGDPATSDESITYVREKVLPQVRQMPGAKGMVSMLDRQTGQAISFTLWESEEAMRSTEEAANRMRDDAAADMESSIAAVERFEVFVDERF